MTFPRVFIADPDGNDSRPLSIQAIQGVDRTVGDLAERAAGRLGKPASDEWTLASNGRTLARWTPVTGLAPGGNYELVGLQTRLEV